MDIGWLAVSAIWVVVAALWGVTATVALTDGRS